MSDTTTVNDCVPIRSTKVAYYWWLTLFFGAHRFYVGKWLTGLLYPVFLLVFISIEAAFTDEEAVYVVGFYFALLLVDAFFIPRSVRRRNEWFEEDFRAHPNRYLIPDSEDIAPWARGQKRKSGSGLRRSFLRVYFFFWLVPFFTGVWAAQLQSLEVLIIPIVVLAAIGLIGTLDRMLEHQPVILEIPGVGPALERVAEMRAHFWEHEPKISRSIWGLFRHWKEYKPYWTLALVVAATVVIEGVIAFEDNTRFIEWIEAGKIVGSAALIGGFVVLANLVPITTLSFHYSLSGKRTRLRFMTVGALVATMLGFYVPSLASLSESIENGAGRVPSYLSRMRLENRLKDPGFRKELQDKIDVFLWYYINKNMDQEQMNENFRSLLMGLVPNDESDAFEIIERDKWAAVVYYHNEAECILNDQQIQIDKDLVVEQVEESKYSLLAVVVKNTDLRKMSKLQDLPDNLEFEDFDTLEDTEKLNVIAYVNNRQIFYQWDESLDNYIDQPECRASLLCDENAGGCY